MRVQAGQPAMTSGYASGHVKFKALQQYGTLCIVTVDMLEAYQGAGRQCGSQCMANAVTG